MILHDWEPVPSDVDVCIVGSGPVGLALALKCANQGLSVAILEAGEEREATKGGDAPYDDSVTPHHVTPSLAAASGLGGTSRLWSGRCVPLDDIDFEERAFVPFSGWPITRADISVYHTEALEFLGSGAGSPPPSDWILGGNVSNTVLERWSSEPDLSRLHGQALRTSQDIKVCTSCTATEIKFDDGRRATALIARRRGHVVEVKAKFLVLAAGGLGNTRLLLATQRKWPRKFGGPGGPLGGFCTGHLTGYLAKIRFHQQALVPGLWYQKGARGTFTRRRLSISPETQRTQSLLNIGFWLDPISIADPAHCSGALSAIYLGLETLGLYKRLGSGLAPSTIRGKSGAKRQHWANIRGDGEIIPGLLSVVSCRVRQGMATRMRGLVNPTGHYLLRFHAEQAPIQPTACGCWTIIMMRRCRTFG
ncbi:FAD-binding protein [Mesorhizobium sp. 1B3]|uniref:FAD-binding protein n=1 Tax=Mesorhizobium sp. 1B3 TaxID=3243599 RepID=UPI003D97BAC0